MPTIPLVIQITGLLLLTPDSPAKTFPMHVLMPVEGQSGLSVHVAQLGWPSTRPVCLSKGPGYTWEPNVCWFNLGGWAVEIGKGGAPTSLVMPPDPFDVSYLKRIDRAWFGPMPVNNIRSRVSIFSGRMSSQCSAAKWTVGGLFNRELPNVIDWTIDIPDTGLTLTASRQDGDSAVTKTITSFPAGARIDLILRHEPEKTPTPQSEPYEAHHFHAFYELLGYTLPVRVVPYNGKKNGTTCTLTGLVSPPNPGTPTCMPVVGTP